MKKINRTREGSEVKYEPRLVGEILNDYFENSSEPLAVAFRNWHAQNEKVKKSVWNRNTDLCVDVKTLLRSDRTARKGRCYQGLLSRDGENHFTFVEILFSALRKRNPRVFDGKFITVTRRDDGSFRPNFKPMRIGKDISVDDYALRVMNELRNSLNGLIQEKASKK